MLSFWINVGEIKQLTQFITDELKMYTRITWTKSGSGEYVY